MTAEADFHISSLSLSEHSFQNYHFCRGNNSKRKSRIGLIEAGSASFMYLNERIPVQEGDVVFIPGKIFCYSEWMGQPDIRVFYLSFDIECDESDGSYQLQTLPADEEIRALLRRIRALLEVDDRLEAYSLFYHALSSFLPHMNACRRRLDKSLYDAIDYITCNWNRDFSVGDVARECSLSESKIYHLFQEQLGQTPVSYLNAVRVNYAIQYLENEHFSIAEICRLTNFHSESYFRRVFRSITGLTPSEYRRACQKA